MLAITRRNNQNTIEIEASGRLTSADYERFGPAFEVLAQQSGPLRVLLTLKGFRGWTPTALWSELKFDLSHRSDFARIAVVGDKAWQHWGTWLSKPLFKAPMRYFPRTEVGEARAWLSLKKR